MNVPKIKHPARRIVCKDGASLSVQASAFHYSDPRADVGPYTAVEVGFIQDAADERIVPPESWRSHADGEFPNAVYAFVPVELVTELIEAHGGIASGQMP